jgi:hypothetical protein
MSDASSGATTLLPFLLLGIAGVLIHVSPA